MQRLLLVLSLVVCLPTLGGAQVAERPARPYRGLFGGGRPPDPNRTRHELTLTANMLGGYDDVISPDATPRPIEPTQIRSPGFSGFADATLRYFYGKAARSFSAETTAFAHAYSNINIDPMVGGDVRFTAETALGRRARLSARQDLGLRPSLVLGAFAPLATDVDPSILPETGRTVDFAGQRSWSSNTGMSLTRNWTARQSSLASYGYSRLMYVDELGFDTVAHAVSAQHAWAVSRTLSIDGSYSVSERRLSGGQQDVIPVTDHSFQSGVTYLRRLSPTRRILFAGGAGATYVDTSTLDLSPIQYWAPAGYGTVSLELGRSWAVSGNYRRAISVLPGLSTESFATDAASVHATGIVGRRIEFAMSGAFSNGRPGGGPQPAQFEIYSGLAQMRYAIARSCAVSVNYNYYYYQLRDIGALPPGFPRAYDRHAVRVGVTFFLPLYGSYRGPAERRIRVGR